MYCIQYMSLGEEWHIAQSNVVSMNEVLGNRELAGQPLPSFIWFSKLPYLHTYQFTWVENRLPFSEVALLHVP